MNNLSDRLYNFWIGCSVSSSLKDFGADSVKDHAQKEAQHSIAADLLALLPFRIGGAAIGRNYWSGVAKGNNDAIDQIEAALKEYCGVDDE